MNVIGIDLGGTTVKMGILLDSDLIETREIPVQDNQSWQLCLPEVEAKMNELINSAGINKLDGIGLAFPGQVDSQKMQIRRTTKYRDAPGFDFVKWAKTNWDMDIVLENDARLACIGEWKFGAGIGCDNMLMVTLGTGIGSGVILEGKIVYGKNFRAGNLIGHTILDYTGEECQCGNRGCAESLASTWSLKKLIQNDPDYPGSIYTHDSEVNFKSLFQDYSKDVAIAKRTIKVCLEIWSAAITNLVHDFDPELVILGGGVMKSSNIILPLIKEQVLQRSWSSPDEINFSQALLGNHASFWGAKYLLEKNQ